MPDANCPYVVIREGAKGDERYRCSVQSLEKEEWGQGRVGHPACSHSEHIVCGHYREAQAGRNYTDRTMPLSVPVSASEELRETEGKK